MQINKFDNNRKYKAFFSYNATIFLDYFDFFPFFSIFSVV